MENLSGMSSSIPVFEKRISEVEKDTEEIYSRIAKLELSPDTQTLLSSRYKPIAPSRGKILFKYDYCNFLSVN